MLWCLSACGVCLHVVVSVCMWCLSPCCGVCLHVVVSVSMLCMSACCGVCMWCLHVVSVCMLCLFILVSACCVCLHVVCVCMLQCLSVCCVCLHVVVSVCMLCLHVVCVCMLRCFCLRCAGGQGGATCRWTTGRADGQSVPTRPAPLRQPHPSLRPRSALSVLLIPYCLSRLPSSLSFLCSKV